MFPLCPEHKSLAQIRLRSRPIEWIATCPIMQLKLVVLAGARVPNYRRFMMPLLSVAVLLCGTASMFTGDALRFGWYGFGLCSLPWRQELP